MTQDLWITAAIYQPFFIAFKEQVPKDFYSDAVSSRDATFFPKAEQDRIKIGKINNTSRRKKTEEAHE